MIYKASRDDKIRTCDPLHPMQVRYRAALRPEFGNSRAAKVGENIFWGQKMLKFGPFFL